jgi:hypothetical protein
MENKTCFKPPTSQEHACCTDKPIWVWAKKLRPTWPQMFVVVYSSPSILACLVHPQEFDWCII